MRSVANGAGERINWNDVDWRQTYRAVRNLRQRIFRASQQGDRRKLASLQKLMLRSRANALVAVRQVTQINQGKNTPGVDRLVVRTSEARGRLVEQMLTYQPWRARPVKRILIPKRNGKFRPLGIPTVIDRAMQAVVKNALEPCWEAVFEASSYGFRPGRNCHDAIARVFSIARPNKAKKWVLDADIEGAFDNIDHTFLLRTIGPAPGRVLIRQWLKAGVLVDGALQETPRGTPQGGVISPLLANIALHGMEVALGVKYTSRGTLKSKRALVRYADDFVIFCETQEDAHATKAEIETWLGQRGLRLAESKTRIVHLSKGFDFLGFTVRHYPMPRTTRSGWKLLITPSRGSVQQIRNRLRTGWRTLVGQNAEAVIATLNPLIRGWANYFRIGVAKHTFNMLDAFMVHRALRWTAYTHPRKPWRWRINRYWGLQRTGTQNRWIFGHKPTGKLLLMFHWFPIERHVLVRGRASPDDASQRGYWAERERGRSQGLSAAKKKLADAQRGTCPHCGQTLYGSEALHAHHIVPRSKGGTNVISNLQLVHQQCHEQIHALIRRYGMRSGLPEPCAGKPARTVPRGERSHPPLLPYDGYETGKLRYPVIFLLHGNGADQNEWVVQGNMQRTVDQLIRDEQMPPAVIVMPSATTTWYVDRKEMMETAFLKDLFPEIEAKFRVMKDRSGRVIGGESMGGYGSLRFVLKYPEMFAAAALISPAIYNPEPPETSSARRVGVFGAEKYETETWKSFNYPTLLDAFFAKNISMPIYVGSGDDDDFMIESQATAFYALWRQKKQPGELRIYNGAHTFEAFNAQFPEAVRYIFRTVRRPEMIAPPSQ